MEPLKSKDSPSTLFSLLSARSEYYLNQGKYSEALQDCNQLLSLNLQELSLRPRLYKAKCLYKLGHHEQYTECLSETLKTHPGCSKFIDEYARQILAGENSTPKLHLEQLFKTFSGWREIEEKLEESLHNAQQKDKKDQDNEKDDTPTMTNITGEGDTSLHNDSNNNP